jgi:O-antigen/teichoic acid export membrane protein
MPLFRAINSIPIALRGSSLARNALWISAGQIVSLVVQALSFILLARLLGSREYGILIGAVAFVSLFSQYSGAGSGSVFLRYVSVHPEQAAVYSGNMLLSLAIFGTALVAAVTVAAHYVLSSTSLTLVLVVAVSDCFLRQIATMTAQVFQAFEHMKITAFLTSLTNFARLVTVGAMLLVYHQGTSTQWAWASAGVSALAALVSVVLVQRQVRGVSFSFPLLKKRAVEGFGFSFAASTNSIYNDVDKTMLSHYGMNVANGIYSTAYRVIDIATMPIWSIYTSALPRMFREGKVSIEKNSRTARKLLSSGIMAGLAASILCYFCAPLVPLLAGKSFAASISAIRWLCLLPVFRAFALSAGAGLTTSGNQTMRTCVQVIAAAFNFGINLYLIPRYSWIGAAWSSLLTDAFMGIGNWMIYLLIRKRSALAIPIDGA